MTTGQIYIAIVIILLLGVILPIIIYFGMDTEEEYDPLEDYDEQI